MEECELKDYLELKIILNFDFARLTLEGFCPTPMKSAQKIISSLTQVN
jgi:hypothetical protein